MSTTFDSDFHVYASLLNQFQNILWFQDLNLEHASDGKQQVWNVSDSVRLTVVKITDLKLVDINSMHLKTEENQCVAMMIYALFIYN